MQVVPKEVRIKNELLSNTKNSFKSKGNSKKIQPNKKRNEIYSCLCTKLNEKFKSIWINQLFGSPCYVSFLLTIIGISTITTIIVLSQVVNTKLNRSYFANCTSNSNCDNLLGLSCSAQDGSCNCPAGKTKGHCDCSNGYFWNGSKCTKVMQYSDTGCSSNFMCDQSKYLSCVNKTCKCGTLKVFDIVSQTCRFNYLGCYYDINNGGNCYITALFNQMPYFIDTCINTCKSKMFNFTSVFIWGSNSPRCNCQNTVNFNLAGFCEMICIDRNGEKYTCGSITGGNNGYSRSVFLNYGN